MKNRMTNKKYTLVVHALDIAPNEECGIAAVHVPYVAVFESTFHIITQQHGIPYHLF